MNPDINEHEGAAQIMAILEKSEKPEAEPVEGQASEEAETPQSTEPESSTEEQETTQEPAETQAIEPPPTWKPELKAKWNALPPDLQQDLAQWETERNQGVNAKLSESAKAKQAAEAEIAAAQQERQRYAQQLEQAIHQTLTLDPVLAQAAQTDWVKMWAERPAEAGLLRAQVEQRVNALQAMEAERQRAQAESIQAAQVKAEAAIREKIADWQDDAKRESLKANLTKYLTEKEGFKPEELSLVLDPRHVSVAHKAMLWDQMQQARNTVVQKKVATPPARVPRPAANDGPEQESARFKALKSRALRTDKDDDKVAAVLARIG